MSHPPSTQLSLSNWAICELSNGGQSYQEFIIQKVRLLVKAFLKFGMVGTYNKYFWNLKRKGKVTFWS